MLEADRRVDYDVAGEEHFFPAGTDMHGHVAWRVTGGVEVVTPAPPPLRP